MPRLDTPKRDYMPSYIAALREGFESLPAEKIAEIEQDPQGFLDKILAVRTDPVIAPNGLKIPRVPATEFWYVIDDYFIGRIGIRHELNDHLLASGGNIGYEIRPCEQGKGHASAMVKNALDFCRNTLKLEKVLLTADENNIASIKVIEKNGGILEDKRICLFSNVPMRRYWITL